MPLIKLISDKVFYHARWTDWQLNSQQVKHDSLHRPICHSYGSKSMPLPTCKKKHKQVTNKCRLRQCLECLSINSSSAWLPRWSSVMAAALRMGDPVIEPHFAQSSHTSDLKTGALVATLPASGMTGSLEGLVIPMAVSSVGARQ